MGKLYTIGHSTIKYELFRELLKKYNIDCLLDVRSTPYSKYAAQYNRDIIAKYLNMDGIRYVYAGNYFGARQLDTSLYDQYGCLDFEKVRKTDFFQSMVNNVKKGLQDGHNVVLMCTEKEPYDCHRAIMVARGFELADVPIAHIEHDGDIMSQDELNKYLLDKYFPHRNQMVLSFGDDDEITDEERLIEAYRKCNKEIGYHINAQEKGLVDNEVIYNGIHPKTGRGIFSKIKANHIELLLDIRLNNNSQLAGFTKGRDLIYFLKELCQAEYVHGEIFAPTKTLLTEYKHGDISWEEYEAIYAQLYSSRCMQKYFQETFGGYSNILLLCSEPTPEKCHRRLLAEWLRSDIEGIEIYHL